MCKPWQHACTLCERADNRHQTARREPSAQVLRHLSPVVRISPSPLPTLFPHGPSTRKSGDTGISLVLTLTLASIGPDHTPTFPSDPGDEGCKTATARYCATTTSFGVSTSGGVTSTTKTSVLSTCGTLAGCDATGTSTAAATTSTCAPSDNSCPTASSYPYVVYPEDGRNVQSVKALAERLKFYTPDPSKILTSDTKDLGVNYWQLPLNESVVEQVRQLPDVCSKPYLHVCRWHDIDTMNR